MDINKSSYFSEAFMILQKQGYEPLNVNRIDSIPIVEIKCNKGHTWKSTFDKVTNRLAKCPHCGNSKLSNNEKFIKAKGIAYQNKGKLLSYKFIGEDYDLEWQTEDGKTFKSSYNNVVNNGFWPKNHNSNEGELKGVLPEAHTHAEANKGKCNTYGYAKRSDTLEWECSEGHVFQNRFDSQMAKRKFCPECRKAEQKNTLAKIRKEKIDKANML